MLDYYCGDTEQAEQALTEQYVGCYKSLEDFAESYYSETGQTQDIPESIRYYIDFAGIGRDMELNGDVFTFETGFEEVHVFWTC